MTKHEIIDRIASSYTLNTRAIKNNGSGGNSCVYHNDKGFMCGVGMTLINPDEADKSTNPGEPSSVIDVWHTKEELWEDQKEEYRGHNLEFWRRIQSFHDDINNWTEGGLSVMGQREVDRFKTDCDENKY